MANVAVVYGRGQVIKCNWAIASSQQVGDLEKPNLQLHLETVLFSSALLPVRRALP